MPIPWLTILQTVPWTDVIRNAPKVADGARKLWNTVGKKPGAAPPDEPVASGAVVPAHDLAALEAHVAGLQAELSGLHEQMLASSELIKELAEQNAQLIRRIERNRVQLLWLGAATLAAAVAAVAGLLRTIA